MNKRKLIEKSKKFLEEFRKLPPEVQWNRLVKNKTIDKDGNVLMGKDVK